MARAGVVVAQQRLGNGLTGDPEFLSQENEKQLHQPHESDAISAAYLSVEPFGKMHEGMEGRGNGARLAQP